MITKNVLLNSGLLVLRVGIGVIFIIHGLPKLMGGSEVWSQLGSTMSLIGISFAPAVWGFFAAAAETLGGVFILLGFLHRFSALALVFTMLIAILMHTTSGDPFAIYSNALKVLVIFVALTITGPGRYSVDYMFFRRIS